MRPVHVYAAVVVVAVAACGSSGGGGTGPGGSAPGGGGTPANPTTPDTPAPTPSPSPPPSPEPAPGAPPSFDEGGFLADLVARPVPVDADAPAPGPSTCASRTVNGPGNESFAGPIPCSAGFCLENFPAAAWLYGIAGASSRAVWVVGEGALLRYDGARWDTACGPLDGWMLYAAHAASDRDAWIAGGGTLAHFDGTSWTATPGDPAWTSLRIWGDAAEAFATISGGIVRWDGARWARSYSPPYASPTAVWGDAAGRAWAVEGGGLLAWDGATWVAAQRPFNLNDGWAPRGGAPWFAGFTYRDPEWWVHDAAVGTVVDGAYARRALPSGYAEARWIRGSAPDDVWVGVSSDANAPPGTVLRWDGAAWSPIPQPPRAPLYPPPLVLGRSDAWAVENALDPSRLQTVGRVIHFDGGGWTDALAVEARSVAGIVAARDGLWAAGEEGLWRFDGARWTSVHGRLGYGVRLATDGTQVWAAGLADAGGSTVVARWDGSGVSASSLPGSPTAIHAAGGHAWIATTGSAPDALVHHWDGASWTALDVGAPMTVDALWASRPDDLWAVGAVHPATWTSITGVIAHWDGTRWARREMKDYELTSVWGSGPGDVWLSGDTSFCQKCPPVAPAPLLLRWDGTRLAMVASAHFQEITGTGAADAWAIASTRPSPTSGWAALMLYRFDGARWSALARLDVPFRPFRLHAAADGTLWGVDGGRILRRAPAR